MPPLITSSVEHVRVLRSEQILGAQLCYLPLHELRRQEILLRNIEEKGLRVCTANTIEENSLVAVEYNDRFARGQCLAPVWRSGVDDGLRASISSFFMKISVRYSSSSLMTSFSLPGYVLEIRATGARVDLMDYGFSESFRFHKLRHLSRIAASTILRYGVRAYCIYS